MITVTAPGKIHLLGEHVVVHGKPAILTSVDLRVTVTLSPTIKSTPNKLKKVVEPIVKKHFKITKIPPYQININSQLPIGAGLGSSAAISACYIAALLTYLKINWDLELVNDLTYQAEKIFHGNPSGGDNSTVVFGGLVWFRKESADFKIIKQLPFTIPAKLAKNFIIINTGQPEETTKQMIEIVKPKINKVLDKQEELVKQLLTALKTADEKQLIQIIKLGEKNLEYIGACSPFVKKIVRQIEKMGGAAKICGGGGKTKATGVLLCYHPKPSVISDIAKSLSLPYFITTLGAKGLKENE